MQKALRHGGSPPVHHDSDQRDPEAVHDDGHGDAGKECERPFPDGRLEKVGENQSQGHQGKQITQAAAGFRNLQLVAAQIDHIAFQQDADPGHAEEPDAQLRGEQLQFRGNVFQQELRQRHHGQQQQQGHAEPPYDAPARQRQHNAVDDQQQSVLLHHIQGRQTAEHLQRRTQGDDRESPPGALEAHPLQEGPALPDQEGNNQRDQNRMAVLFPAHPDVHHLAQAGMKAERRGAQAHQRQGPGRPCEPVDREGSGQRLAHDFLGKPKVYKKRISVV